MRRRVFGAGMIALALAVASAALRASSYVGHDDGYEMWQDCTSLPGEFGFLPIYLGSESPGFIDLGDNLSYGPTSWRKMQYTRDKNLGRVQISAGRWYSGIGSERWPTGTVDVIGQATAFRVTKWIVDGTTHIVSPSCVWSFTNPDLSGALYNVWVRFAEPGVHTLKIYSEQVLPFPFKDPVRASFDPLGLEGRRIFVQGEVVVGEDPDGQFVHTYELHVGGAGLDRAWSADDFSNYIGGKGPIKP